MSRCRYGRDRQDHYFRSIAEFVAAKKVKTNDKDDEGDEGDDVDEDDTNPVKGGTDSQADAEVESDVIAHLEKATKRIQAKHGNLTKKEVHSMMVKHLSSKYSSDFP